jgi:hypothetical protein
LAALTGRRAAAQGVVLRAGRRARMPVSWVRDSDTGNSDHREFELIGLPGMKLGVAGDDPCRHTPCDRPSRLDRASLRGARRILEAALSGRKHPARPGARGSL